MLDHSAAPTPTTARDPSHGAFLSLRPAAWLSLLLLALCVQRLRTWDEPFQRDIMTYAVIGHELVMGSRLYADVLDHKPPAVYATFALAERLAGYGPAEVYLVNVVFAAATLLGLYLAASRPHGRSLGLLAALLWLLFSYDLDLEGNQPNTEACLNALSILSFALVASDRLSRCWAAGALLALGSLYKPVALLLAPVWVVALLVPAARRGLRLKDAVTRATALCLPSVLAWAAVFAYFSLDGRFGIFTATVITFNREYAGDLSRNLARGLSPAMLWPAILRLELPLLALAVIGLGVALAREARAALPLAGYWAGAVAMVALPGQWWPHYYQLYLPPLVLGAVLGVAQTRRLPAAWAAPARAVLLLGVVGLALAGHLRQLRLDGDAASLRKYGRNFIAVRQAAREAAALLGPHDAVFVYGIDPGVYFDTGRRPITQALWINHVRGSLGPPLRQSLRRQLRERPPELIVRDTRYTLDWIPPGLVEWLEAEYEARPRSAAAAPFRLLVRRKAS